MARGASGLARPGIAPARLLAAAVAAALLWAYWPVLEAMTRKWVNDPQYSHGFLVPPFVAFLLWTRRHRLPAAWPAPSAWGVALLAAGAALRLAGAFWYYDWPEAVSLLPCLGGLALLAGGGPALRGAWPGIAFLLFMVPLPYRLESALAGPLQEVAAWACTVALQALGRPAVADGNLIAVNGLQIEVVVACSGLGSLFVFFAIASGLALVSRRPLVDRIILVLSAAPVALLANVVRITATALLQEAAGGEGTFATFHDLAGWLMMLLAFGVLWAELWLLRHLFVTPAQTAPQPG